MAEEGDAKETEKEVAAQPAEPHPEGAALGASGETPQVQPQQQPVKAEAETEEPPPTGGAVNVECNFFCSRCPNANPAGEL